MLRAENFYDKKKRLDVKSTYKHDKIFNGIEYAFINKGLTCKKITNGHIESFAVHVFAIHYYNRIDFSKQDSIITVTNLLEKECEIRYQFTHAGFVSEFNSPEFSICKSDYRNIKMTDLPKSSFIYYIKSENELICMGKNILVEERQLFNVNIQMYYNLDIVSSGDIHHAFATLADYFSQPDAVHMTFESDEVNERENESYVVCFLSTDAEGKILKGIRWFDSPESYYEEYLDGEILKRETIDVVTFQKLSGVYYEQMIVMPEEDE